MGSLASAMDWYRNRLEVASNRWAGPRSVERIAIYWAVSMGRNLRSHGNAVSCSYLRFIFSLQRTAHDLSDNSCCQGMEGILICDACPAFHACHYVNMFGDLDLGHCRCDSEGRSIANNNEPGLGESADTTQKRTGESLGRVDDD